MKRAARLLTMVVLGALPATSASAHPPAYPVVYPVDPADLIRVCNRTRCRWQPGPRLAFDRLFAVPRAVTYAVGERGPWLGDRRGWVRQ